VSDPVGLSKYIFSFDNGVGTLTNSTTSAFSADPQTVYVNETLTSTLGATIRFQWFFNDTNNLWNSTGIQSYATGTVAFQDTFSSGNLDKWTKISTIGNGVNTVLSNDTYDGAAYDYHSCVPLNSEAWLDAIDVLWSLGSVFLSTSVKFTELNIPNGCWRNVLYGLNGYPTVGQLSAQVYNNSGTLEWRLAFSNTYFSPLSSASVTTGVWYDLVMLRSYPGTATQELWVNGTSVLTWSYNVQYPFEDFEIGVGSQSGAGENGPCAADYDNAEVYLPFPSYTSSSVSTTVAGTFCTFTTTFIDSIKLSKYMFSFANGTSTFVNGTWTAFTSNPQTISVTKKLNTTVGATIKWRWYANDTNGNFNDTNVESFIATLPLSCSVSPSGSITMDIEQSETFTITASGGMTPYTYQWYLNDVAVSGATSSSWSWAPSSAGSYAVYVNITDATGYVATSNAASFTVNNALFCSITPTDVTIDAGQSQTFNASATGGTLSYSYQWYLDGTAASGATNSTWTYPSASSGTHAVYCIVIDSATTPDNEQSNPALVSVNAALAAIISPTSAALDANQSVTLTATASGGSGNYSSYQWYVDGLPQSGQSSTFIYSTSAESLGTHSITVTVTDNLGATSPQSSPATVTVNTPLAAPSVVASPNTIDQGETFVLSNHTLISTGTGPYSYEWFEMAPGGSYALVGSELSFSFVTSSTTAIGGSSFILQVTDNVGVAVNSTAATVMVNSALVAPVVTASSQIVDQGQTSILKSSSMATGTGPYAYQWLSMAPSASAYYAIDGANLSSYSFVTSNSTAPGVWYFELNVTDATGAVMSSNVVSVTVNPEPSVSASPSSVTLRVGQFQVFTATTSGGTGSLSYQWYLNGQAVGTGVTYNFSVQLAGSDSIYVTATDSASSPYTATSNTASVTVSASALIHDIVVTSITPSKGIIVEAVQGHSVSVNITVWNEGDYTETFNVTLYGALLWGWENDTFSLYVFTGVTLTPGSVRMLTVSITLPAFPWGVYVLKAIAGPVPGQTRASDLVCTGGSISVFSPKIRVWWFYGRCGLFGFMPL
jgi:hypothetical protein